MWKLFKLLGWAFKALTWLIFALAVAGLIALYILERGIPEPAVRRLSEACSSNAFICRIERATFSLKTGFRLHRVKLFPKRVADAALATVDEIVIDVALRPRLKPGERLRGVTLKNVRFPSLPPQPTAPEGSPAASAPASAPADGAPRWPSVAPFPLTLENADILGVRAERITAMVSVQEPRVCASQLVIQWPDKNFSMSVSGRVTADFATRVVAGDVKGQAFPGNILPLLRALRSRGAIKQIDCFTNIERPINADAQFDVNIDNSDFVLRLGLDVGPCAYRGVPMKFAKGSLCAYGTNIYTTVDVGPIQAESATGPLAGRLVYREDGESLDLDVSSAMDLTHLVTIINILNHGQLKPVRCDTPPRVKASGIMALDSQKSTVTNCLTGTISFDEGSIFNMRVRNVTSDLKVDGYSALLGNISGASASGGNVAGNVSFSFPCYSSTATLFTARAALTGVDLSDLTPVFNITNTRAGTVSGSLLLHGTTHGRTMPSLSGEGHVSIRDGLLHRMPVFAGFTDYLASSIPGVSSLVNQSTGSMDFTVEGGILRTENLLIEGDLFSMQGRGSCNLDTEALDFIVRANIFKEKTFAGRITRLVTMPFTRLLLEFKVFGTIDSSDWSYVSIIEKITGGLSDLTDQLKSAPSEPSPKPAPQQPNAP